MDWAKILTAVGTAIVGGLCTWGIPAARRVAKRWGKTEVQLADEELARAVAGIEEAKHTASDADDKTAFEIAQRARAARIAAIKRAAFADALAGDDVPQP